MAKKKKSIKKIDIHYKKTESYRSFHVDGAFGGITPKTQIYMELFLDRNVTPQKITYAITKDNKLGNELSREGKSGLIRQIEAGIIMDVQTAENIRNWLDDKIKLIKSIPEKE